VLGSAAPEFEDWLASMGIVEDGTRLRQLRPGIRCSRSRSAEAWRSAGTTLRGGELRPDAWSSLRRFTSLVSASAVPAAAYDAEVARIPAATRVRATRSIACWTRVHCSRNSRETDRIAVLASAAPDRHTYVQRPDSGASLG